jgi:SSS family solute:Na+ symporter
MNFTPIDWIIVAVYLGIVFYVGILGKRYVSDSADFLIAGRSMGLYAGMISLVATEIGIITYMYYAEMGVVFGFAAFLSAIITAAVYILVGRTGFVIKRYRELELVTISHFFETQYGRDVRILAGILMAVGGALNFGVFPIIEATFLNIVTGVPQQFIIWTMVFLMAIVLLYTVLGGMVSVIVTNYVQYVVLALGMLIITFYCFYSVGWAPMVTAVQTNIGEKGFNPMVNPDLGWKFIIWQVFSWLALLTTWAPIASRTFSSDSPQTSRKIFSWTGYLALARGILPFVWGIAAMAYLGHRVGKPIEAMPIFLREVLPPGVLGLVIAGMLAASMSTYSGYLLAWSSVISQDVVMPMVRRPLSSKTQLVVNQVTIVVLTVFIIAWGLFYIVPTATYFYLQMTANLFLAGTFWAVVGGLYWKRAHRFGALCSLVLGGAATSIYFVIPNPQSWTGAIGIISFGAALFGMWAGSLAGPYITSGLGRGVVLCVVVATVPVLGYFLNSGAILRELRLCGEPLGCRKGAQ